MDPMDSSESSFSENSNYSDSFSQRSTTHEKSNHADQHEINKRIHRKIEADRRKIEGERISELTSLITNSNGSKSSKVPQLVLLKTAADLLDKLNSRNQYDPLRPSYLTETEVNFLNLEASHAFLFVATIESPVFRIVHVTDSILRILHFTHDQWLNQDLFSFVHPEDLFQVQNQLLESTQLNNEIPSIKCRLRQGNDSYSSVIIDGMVKKLDESLKPVSINEFGYFCFIGICHLPLTTVYNEKNMRLYKDSQSLIFSCRCTPPNWIIYLVDRSISTLPSISFDLFRNRSILDFIHTDEQLYVHQTLLNSAITSKDELITCHFIYQPNEILTMVLDIKPFSNPSTKQTDFIELTFKNITDLVRD